MLVVAGAVVIRIAVRVACARSDCAALQLFNKSNRGHFEIAVIWKGNSKRDLKKKDALELACGLISEGVRESSVRHPRPLEAEKTHELRRASKLYNTKNLYYFSSTDEIIGAPKCAKSYYALKEASKADR